MADIEKEHLMKALADHEQILEVTLSKYQLCSLIYFCEFSGEKLSDRIIRRLERALRYESHSIGSISKETR